MNQSSPYLADPSSIEPFSKDGVLQVVIETPKNSRNKYAFDHERRVIVLKKLLPAGMSFPYDFGFVPSTLAEDGDQIDVLVLMDEPAFPGCVLEARVIGVVEGEDELEGGETQRNDRLLAVAVVSQSFSNVQTVEDLPHQLVKAFEEFFVAYPRILSEKVYRLLGTKGPEEALMLVEAARKNQADSTNIS
jgi:inorganic pyrophosphatase